MTPVELHLRIKKERERRGWGQSDLAEKIGVDVSTVGRWERGERAPHGKNRKKLFEVFQWAEDAFWQISEEDHPAPKLHYWQVPYTRSSYFTGRQDLLEHLHDLLQTPTATLIHAITGLGGIGKTSLAVEYAYRYAQDQEEYSAVLWAQASSPEELFSACRDIAALLNLPEQREQDQQRVIGAVKHWLTNHTGWLLILDNVEDFHHITHLLPQNTSRATGHVIVTTRLQAPGPIATPLEIPPMEHEEGALILLRRAQKLAVHQELSQAETDDREDAITLSQTLAGLPLALDQAGAYIEETGCSLAQYQERYQTHRAYLLSRRGALTQHNDHPAPVTITFLLSLKNIDSVNPAAADLLRFYAFLAPDNIPEELLKVCNVALPPSLQTLARNPTLFDEALALIRRYSLVSRLAKQSSLSIHRVVQAVIHDDLMGKGQLQEWEVRVVAAITTIFATATQRNLTTYERYIPQALTCIDLIMKRDMSSPAIGHLIFLMSYTLTRRAQYEQAERLCVKGLHLYQQALGPVHPEIATQLANLASLYDEQRRHTKAQELFEQALAILQQTYPPHLLNQAMVLTGLARCHWFQGHFIKAEELMEQALPLIERFAGPTSHAFANALTLRATLYRDRGEYYQAEQYYRRALTILENIYPSDHEAIGQCLDPFATNYLLQGDVEHAELLYRRALSILEATLGPNHPDVAGCLCRLADLSMKQKKYHQAEELYKRALIIYEKIGGPNYLEVNRPLLGLAILNHCEWNKLEEAEAFYKRAIAIIEESQGPEHPDLIEVLTGYANLLIFSKGQLDKGKQLMARAQALYRKIRGE